MSAYACEPHKGSEPEVGWQWALQMARFHDVTVLTRANNRAVIEPEWERLRGLNRATLRLHLKECEFRFNHRRDNLYRLLLNEFKNNPLN